MMVSEVEYVPKEISSKQENRFKWTLAALLVVIIVLIILIGILSVYANLNGKPLCTTKECLQTAASIKASMDETYDPCDNFYKFACNNFEEVNLGHANPMEEYTNFKQITNRLNHKIQKFLEKKPRKNDSKSIKIVKNFYNACNDKKKREELGYSVMDKHLYQAGLPKVPTIFTLPVESWDTYKFDWVKTGVALKKTFDIDMFVNVYNEGGHIWMIAQLEPPKIPQAFSDEELALFDKLHIPELIKTEFKQSVIHIISEVLADELKQKNYRKTLDRASEAIWNITFETFKAKKLVGGGESYETRQSELKNITFKDLHNLTNIMLKQNNLPSMAAGEDWITYVNVLFKEITGLPVNLGEEDVIYYYEKELSYIVATQLLLAKVPDVLMELFAWWKAVFLMIANTTEEIADTVNNLLYSDKENALKDCTDLSVEFFNSAIGFGIITKEFLAETKPGVEKFIQSLRDAFLERLEEIEWIDDITRERAIKKLLATKVYVGAPDWILNETHVNEEFSKIKIRSDSHLNNLIQVVQDSVVKEFEKYFIKDGQASFDYYGTVSEVNAYYVLTGSSIVIPWSILQPPAYHLGLRSLNYGVLGTIIGHELTHGFDATGRLYDDQSNFKLWWTQQSSDNFEEKSKCFVEQYNDFTIRIFDKDIKVNGTSTLNENMADNGGVKLAFYALKKYLKTKGSEYKLPGLSEFSSEQLFFISLAHMWCISEGSDGEQLLNQINEHAPNDVRINGIIQNSKEFADVFKCPLGSNMNPHRKRCDMW